jgi:hypothetical protein
MNEPQETRPFQFGIKSILAVMVIAALSLAVAATHANIASLIVALVGIPIQLALLCAWNGWSWRSGLIVLLVLSMAVTPADPYSMILVAVPASVVYFLTLLVLKLRRDETDV